MTEKKNSCLLYTSYHKHREKMRPVQYSCSDKYCHSRTSYFRACKRRPGLETESEMRVIAGKARRLNLKTIPGIDTRPTTDRIKETLFNILQPELLECRFLDLFSGSGGIGIEALSRGASYAVFVEKNPKAAACIRENLAFTKLAEDGKLLNMDEMCIRDRNHSEWRRTMGSQCDHTWRDRGFRICHDFLA